MLDSIERAYLTTESRVGKCRTATPCEYDRFRFWRETRPSCANVAAGQKV
jgi:hypothetical protein